mmetsp:Transcript_3258/g.6536  ORF Transcript_3258/g.6536 Transcript_3258/m.6536 type:complete len:156 (+) Transcript_3258:94-561(+)
MAEVEQVVDKVAELTVDNNNEDEKGLDDSQKAAEEEEVDVGASLEFGKKKKKKNVPMIVLERNTRNKRKCVTTISGLDLFGVKLNEAAKMFGKKFASGASVTKNAENKEQIDCQGDFLDQAVELILKQYKEVSKKDIYHVESKKKVPYFPEEVEK